jgi:hypothetical protein
MNNRNEWEECFSQLRLVGNIAQNLLRRAAAEEMISGGCDEIGSSDINHHLFGKWMSANKNWQTVMTDYFPAK